jgi:hypothetical protein
MKKVWAGLSLVLLAALIATLVRLDHKKVVLKTAQASDQPHSSVSEDLVEQPKDTLVNQIASRFQRRYGASIGSVVTQAGLLSELDRLQSTHPNQSRLLFDEAVKMAFPNQAAQILRLIDLLIEYEDWVDTNSGRLNRLESVERLAKLWEKRYELFGADADLLWAESTLGGDVKQLQIQAEMDRLSQINDQSASSIADQLLDKIDEIYAGSTAAALLTPNDLGQAVFALDSVQADLAALDPQSRVDQIKELRKKVGYPEEVITQLAQRDQINQQKWDTGYQYQAAKQSLSEQYTGSRYEQELSNLQSATFGSSAPTIAAEERSGFYRFNRPRQFGVN